MRGVLIEVPPAVLSWLAENGAGVVVSTQPVGGGCINNGARLKTSQGETFFLKSNPAAPGDMFAREAEGLLALAVPGGPRIPQPLLAGKDFLLLEDLKPKGRAADYWSAFGDRLAVLHNHTQERFGFHHDNYIGSTSQPNAWMEDGFEFFGELRLSYQTRLAREQGYLNRGDTLRVERLVARLPELIPVQPASLIHGDLWSGNAITDEAGQPALIDPAAHYGWAEAELAMTALFGAFPDVFYKAYTEKRPLTPGYRDRFPIYNLYHLLNHLNLFGYGYLSQVREIIRQFT